VAGAGAGILWLCGAAALCLIALITMYFSDRAFIPIGSWGIAAAVLGVSSVGAAPTARIHRVSVAAGILSAGVAASIAIIAPGSELAWAVVVFTGLAGLYSLIALHLGNRPPPKPDK
jgi:hypothetical protein